MLVEPTPIAGVLVVRPRIFTDARGHFLETWQAARYREAGIPDDFVQDNVSVSALGVVRGLHAQRAPHAQSKLVTVLQGRIYDVAVDARGGSATYGQWVAVELRASEGSQLYIPAGCLHGFQALEAGTVVSYKCSTPYMPEAECIVRYDDAALDIPWPLAPVQLSDRDAAGGAFGVVAPL